MSQIAQHAKRKILAAALALIIIASQSASPLYANPLAPSTQVPSGQATTLGTANLPQRPLFQKSFPFDKATTISELYDIFLDLSFTIKPYQTYNFGSKLPEKYQYILQGQQNPEISPQAIKYIDALYQKALNATMRITTKPGSHEDIQRLTLQHYIKTERLYTQYSGNLTSNRFLTDFLTNFYPYDLAPQFSAISDVDGFLDYNEKGPLPFSAELEVLQQIPPNQKYYLVKAEWQDDSTILEFYTSYTDPTAEATLVKTFKDSLKTLNLKEEEQTKYVSQYQNILKSRLIPHFATLHNTLQGLKSNIIYVKRLQDIPDHKTYYKNYLIPYNTSTQMTPEAIHQLGLREVKRIRIEIDKTLKAMKYKGSLKDCVNEVRKSSKFYLGEESYPVYKKLMARINAKLPLLFDPKNIPTEVPTMAANEHTSYMHASYDGRTKSTFNVGKTRQYELAMPCLTIHEGTLGHHLQFWNFYNTANVHMLNELMPSTVCTEGWALYTEKLAGEYGLYNNPQERLGMLLGELTRAGRLVVDTGINYYDWTFEQGTKYMTDEALSVEADYEVARYHYWPGQALSYKIGEIEILAMRSQAQRALAKSFDIKAWHKMILSEGSITLDALKAKNAAWINEKAGHK